MTRILAAALLAALVAAMACGRGGGDTVTVPALLEAERLLSPEVDAADSALRVLRAVDTAALATDGDRALYALLHTQALYKLTDDPIDTIPILRAVDHYATTRPGSDRHVRALTYAGAAAESNGNPIRAITYYKLGELSVDTSNHFLLGYLNLRIATLYERYYINPGIEIKRNLDAARHFSLCSDNTKSRHCMMRAGNLLRLTFPDSAKHILLKSLALSKSANDTMDCVICLDMLSELALQQNDNIAAMTYFNEAENISSRLLDVMYYVASIASIRNGHLEEAQYYFDKADPSPSNNQAISFRHYAMSEFALHNKDITSYSSSMKAMIYQADSLTHNGVADSILNAEQQVITKYSKNIFSRGLFISVCSIICFLIVLCLLLLAFRQSSIKAMRRQVQSLRKELAERFKNADNHIYVAKTMSDEGKKHAATLIASYNSLLSKLMNMTEHDMYSAKLIESFYGEIRDFKKNHNFVGKLTNLLDTECNGRLIVFASQKKLPKWALEIIVLTYYGFATSEIAILLDLKSEASVRVIKSRTIKLFPTLKSFNEIAEKLISRQPLK